MYPPKVPRSLRLLGATGAIRTTSFHGRPHVVVPVVALVEGVIYPVNADSPELVLASEFSTAPQGWNGRPIVAGHPAESGTQVSANSPAVLEARSFGTIFNTRVDGKRLLMDAWLDVERAKAVGRDAQRVVERAQAGEPIEVSVGVFVMAESKKGEYGGKPYKAIWHEITPDHLAMLDEGVLGACSNAMGCGVRHAQVHFVTAQGIEVRDAGGAGSGNFGHAGRPGEEGGSAPGGGSATGRPIGDIDRDVFSTWKPAHQAAQHDANRYGRPMGIDGGKEYGKTVYRVKMIPKDPNKRFGWETRVEVVEPDTGPYQGRRAEGNEGTMSLRERVLALLSSFRGHEDELSDDAVVAAVEGLRPAVDDDLRDAAGKRHSASDEDLIQAMHDKSVSLGAVCAKEPAFADRFVKTMQAADGYRAAVASLDPTVLEGGDPEHPFAHCLDVIIPAIEAQGHAVDDPEAFCGWWKAEHKVAALKAACSCGGHSSAEGESDMEKNVRVKALIENPATLFTAEDAALLETFPDARLTAMEAKLAEDAKAAEVKTAEDAKAADAMAADLKAAQDKAAKLAEPKSEEQWMKEAPTSIRSLVGRAQAQEQAQKDTLVSQLKAAQDAYTEDELNAMSLDMLQRTAKIAKVATEAPPVDYGARVPRVAADTAIPPPPDMNARIRAARKADTTS